MPRFLVSYVERQERLAFVIADNELEAEDLILQGKAVGEAIVVDSQLDIETFQFTPVKHNAIGMHEYGLGRED